MSVERRQARLRKHVLGELQFMLHHFNQMLKAPGIVGNRSRLSSFIPHLQQTIDQLHKPLAEEALNQLEQHLTKTLLPVKRRLAQQLKKTPALANACQDDDDLDLLGCGAEASKENFDDNTRLLQSQRGQSGGDDDGGKTPPHVKTENDDDDDDDLAVYFSDESDESDRHQRRRKRRTSWADDDDDDEALLAAVAAATPSEERGLDLGGGHTDLGAVKREVLTESEDEGCDLAVVTEASEASDASAPKAKSSSKRAKLASSSTVATLVDTAGQPPASSANIIARAESRRAAAAGTLSSSSSQSSSSSSSSSNGGMTPATQRRAPTAEVKPPPALSPPEKTPLPSSSPPQTIATTKTSPLQSSNSASAPQLGAVAPHTGCDANCPCKPATPSLRRRASIQVLPKQVEYHCAKCGEVYTSKSSSNFNPWWSLVRQACPKCDQRQFPWIDISSETNQITHQACDAKMDDDDDDDDDDEDDSTNGGGVGGGGVGVGVFVSAAAPMDVDDGEGSDDNGVGGGAPEDEEEEDDDVDHRGDQGAAGKPHPKLKLEDDDDHKEDDAEDAVLDALAADLAASEGTDPTARGDAGDSAAEGPVGLALESEADDDDDLDHDVISSDRTGADAATTTSLQQHKDGEPSFATAPGVDEASRNVVMPGALDDDDADDADRTFEFAPEDDADADDAEDGASETRGRRRTVAEKEEEDDRLTPTQAVALLDLFDHARRCPGRHRSKKHADTCLAAKVLMLHVRDCHGTLPNGDPCPFAWCRKLKRFLRHVLQCSDEDNSCPVCSREAARHDTRCSILDGPDEAEVVAALS
eukprot:CAMPEP_0118902868 /NCGR_PEP_ID=MMETSP1166-20130328/7965_1 /TAXON_ID=1104430 /ORGANISM="Chrysoreinhardia sp, Strain CCMP3193" /LENGTH=813 /DNA_ID=CAMNT_0006842083 /DNA_START=178 /DNA_END=2615 /DNA_ORIENTATION=+